MKARAQRECYACRAYARARRCLRVIRVIRCQQQHDARGVAAQRRSGCASGAIRWRSYDDASGARKAVLPRERYGARRRRALQMSHTRLMLLFRANPRYSQRV